MDTKFSPNEKDVQYIIKIQNIYNTKILYVIHIQYSNAPENPLHIADNKIISHFKHSSTE
jgi:hypothetical protein